MSVKCNELKQMLAQKSEVYLLLDQKYCEMLKDLERLQDSLSSKDVEIFEMRKQFNESTKAAENKLLVTRHYLYQLKEFIYDRF